jgi:hypothetical protein
MERKLGCMRPAKTRITVMFALVSSVSASAVAQQYEGVAFGVNNFTPCDASDLYWSKSPAEKFVNELDELNYDQTNVYTNDGVDGRDFVDSQDDDIDPYGTDYADVALFVGHGGHDCDGVGHSWIVMGDNNTGENCRPSTNNTASRQMRFGEGGDGQELDYLFFLACESAHYCVAQDGGYNGMGQHVTTSNSDPFRGIFGFHGIMYNYPDNEGRMKNYVREAETNNLGEAWIDKFYVNNFGLSSHDQCPTGMIWADSADDAETQFFAGGLKDMKGVNEKPNHTNPFYFYVDGCDPNNGEEL